LGAQYAFGEDIIKGIDLNSYTSSMAGGKNPASYDHQLLEEKIIRRLDKGIVRLQQEHTNLAVAPAVGNHSARGSANMLPHIHLVNLGGARCVALLCDIL
jgi:hypothetical protein